MTPPQIDTNRNHQFECDADIDSNDCCSGVCMQRSIFFGVTVFLHIPSWGDEGNTQILLFPKTFPPPTSAASAVSASKEEEHRRRRREFALECRALDLSDISPITRLPSHCLRGDDAAGHNSTALLQILTPCPFCSDLTLQPFAIVHSPNPISIPSVRTAALPFVGTFHTQSASFANITHARVLLNSHWV